MASDRRVKDSISSWLEETAPERLPARVLDTTFERTRRSRQQVGWRGLLGRIQMPRFIPALGGTAVVVMAAVLAFNFIPALGPGGPPTPSPTAAQTPVGPKVTAILGGFLEARIAGAGAEQYLGNEELVPLLYAATSGARYERAEFEQVPGIEWPYGNTAFKVRLFGGDTVVEQLFFVGPDDPLRLTYERDGFGTEIPPTAENGRPVAMSYLYFDGEMTLRAAHPWIFSGPDTYPNPFGRLIPEGPGVPPTTDGGQRNDGWDRLFLIGDPALYGACQAGPNSIDAAALAESILSHPSIEATAPVAASVGAAEALMMDIKIPAGTTIFVPLNDRGDPCRTAILTPVVVGNHATGDWMRLYVLDAPNGSSMRTLAIAIVAPEARFQRAVEAAMPVVDSLEFHVP